MILAAVDSLDRPKCRKILENLPQYRNIISCSWNRVGDAKDKAYKKLVDSTVTIKAKEYTNEAYCMKCCTVQHIANQVPVF